MKEIIDFRYKDRGKDQWNNKKHSHIHHYEILHIHSGSGVIMVNDRLLPIKKDTIVLINGIDTHCSVPDDPAEYIRTKLVISHSFVQSIAEIASFSDCIRDLFIPGGICIRLRLPHSALIDSEMQKIGESLEHNNIYLKTVVMCSIFQILMCAHKLIQHHESPINNKMSDVLHYLNMNISQKIQLNDICSTFHISKYYLCHIFKKTVGMTIFDYILAQRISIAKRKLIETIEPLSEIALSTGFYSFSYFSKTFKEFEGISPKEFRKASYLQDFNTSRLASQDGTN